MKFEQMVQIITLVAVVGGGFYFTGRVTQNLEQLQLITADHEQRLRYLERP